MLQILLEMLKPLKYSLSLVSRFNCIIDYMIILFIDQFQLIILFLYSVDITTVRPFNDTTVREGSATTITCETFGYPPPTVVWSRLNENLSDRVLVSDNVSVPTEYGNVTKVSVNLTITNASREDTGEYMCFANNSVGNDTKIINITVQCTYVSL